MLETQRLLENLAKEQDSQLQQLERLRSNGLGGGLQFNKKEESKHQSDFENVMVLTDYKKKNSGSQAARSKTKSKKESFSLQHEKSKNVSKKSEIATSKPNGGLPAYSNKLTDFMTSKTSVHNSLLRLKK